MRRISRCRRLTPGATTVNVAPARPRVTLCPKATSTGSPSIDEAHAGSTAPFELDVATGSRGRRTVRLRSGGCQPERLAPAAGGGKILHTLPELLAAAGTALLRLPGVEHLFELIHRAGRDQRASLVVHRPGAPVCLGGALRFAQLLQLLSERHELAALELQRAGPYQIQSQPRPAECQGRAGVVIGEPDRLRQQLEPRGGLERALEAQLVEPERLAALPRLEVQRRSLAELPKRFLPARPRELSPLQAAAHESDGAGNQAHCEAHLDENFALLPRGWARRPF